MKNSIYAVLLTIGVAFAMKSYGQTVFENAKAKADAGDGKMAYEAATCLKDGNGVEKNLKLALSYYEKAIKAGVDIPVSVCPEILNMIEETGDTEHSKLFGDCYQKVWDTLFAPYAWNISKRMMFNKYKDFIENFEAGVKMSLTYLDMLEKAQKNTETYELKQRLIAIVRNKPSDANKEKIDDSRTLDFLERLTKFNTKVEIQIAEGKFRKLDQNEQAKFPVRKIGKGIKLYKDIYAGVSLEWLQGWAAASGKNIKKATSPMFEDDVLQNIPETWQGKTFRQNYITDDKEPTSYIFAGPDDEQVMIGCCIGLRNVSLQSIVEKYKKEFSGLKIQEKNVPQIEFIAMKNPEVRITVIRMQPGNFVTIFVIDGKYAEYYSNMLVESARKEDQKALDF